MIQELPIIDKNEFAELERLLSKQKIPLVRIAVEER